MGRLRINSGCRLSEVRSSRLIVVDAYGSADHAVSIEAAGNSTWQAPVGVEAGLHVALFACHETVTPRRPQTAHDLIRQPPWEEIGSVPIDTATCAIADRPAYEPLDVEKNSYEIAGTSAHLCFSNSANADGSYPVSAHLRDGLVKGVYVQFAEIAGEQPD